LRPEFLEVYQTQLCADGLTPISGGSRREKEVNDDEVMKASRFLRENWLISFIRAMDNMEICPYDSFSLTTEMHRKGINIRYLGFICQNSKIPFVRSMAMVEMVARISKRIFQTRLRSAIIHFRSIGATSIKEQMKSYAANLFSILLGVGDKTQKLVEIKLRTELKMKFNYEIVYREYQELSRPALFLALQYHLSILK
jgi:hypothetical protein